MGDQLVMWAPIDGFLPYLAKGWRLSGMVQPAETYAGLYSVLLWKPAPPRSRFDDEWTRRMR